MNNINEEEINEQSIAIIGMSGRFPGAKNVDEFWHNLKNGVESINFFSDQELMESGVDPTILTDTNYVKAKGALENVAEFDATFFGFSPKEAEITDPQQRLFLECAWEALENAGYNPKTYAGSIGVYGGVGSFDTYLLKNLHTNHELRKTIGDFQMGINNSNDFVCTHVSYKLNLSGPSVTVQTACSTSLVAVVMGYQSLLDYQCDMVLAGGATISLPQKSGYLYQEGMILSPDGHCRTFDAKAKGTVSGNGVGIVVLKRLTDALAEGDTIHAIIRGAALSNDGASKIGYTAPSVNGQTVAIAKALMLAEVSPETISYVEAHGTGTPLGDPIEIAALTQAFRTETDKKGFCAIGSVKTNIGHLDAASGVAGFIKTILALKYQQIPASLHFETSNPKLELDKSPFYVNTQLSEWKTNGYPRRAGVSSFGIGGTNAHVILEEAPQMTRKIPPCPPLQKGGVPSFEKGEVGGISEQLGRIYARPWQLLLLSTKTNTALETATTQLVEHLKQYPVLNLADVAYTYQVGRVAFKHRRMLVCESVDDAITALETQNAQRVFTRVMSNDKTPLVLFMFSGQGAQYVNMGLELYQTEAVFREQIEHCAELLQPHLGLDLRTVLYPSSPTPHTPTPSQEENDGNSPLERNDGKSPLERGLFRGVFEQLNQTALTQPALFVIEYALAQLWISWGIKPKAMIGHSIGEYVAACLAGVFSLEDALALVAVRGQLIQSVPAGTMLAVPLPEEETLPLINQHLNLAALNLPSQTVVSGTFEAVEQLATQLAEQGIECQRLHTSHAFHSGMMEPILPLFLEQVQKIQLKSPQIPFISNVTGTWIHKSEATDPNYWVKHLRQTVRFADGLQEIFQESSSILLEVGPGRTLSTFAKRHPDNVGQLVLTSLCHPKEAQSDNAFILNSLGQLWMAGVTVNWSVFYADEFHYRLPLPTYPFERQCYWIEPGTQIATVKSRSDLVPKKPDIADWFYIPSWKRTASPVYNIKALTEPSGWLIFMDECGLGSQLVTRLQQLDQEIITVTRGEQFHYDTQNCMLNPSQPDDYDRLLQALLAENRTPKTIIHLWTVTPNNDTKLGLEELDKFQELGFYSLLFLAQALGKQNITDTLKLEVVSNHLQVVTGEERLCPEKATILGPCKVIPQEYPNISCRSIDIVLPDEFKTWQADKLIDMLLMELTVPEIPDSVIAYRGAHRWMQTFEPIQLTQFSKPPTKLRENGVYLITGGLGGIGLVLAEYLAKTVKARLILLGRSNFPNRHDWNKWLSYHDQKDDISRKIQKVQLFENLGAEVQIIQADITDYQETQMAVHRCIKEFGQINGIVHAAGIAGGGVIQLKTQNLATTVIGPKLHGTLVLNALFSTLPPLDFWILCSSVTSVLAGFGQVDYCSANAFLDAFSYSHLIQNNTTVITSINWDAWQEVGMAVNTKVPSELKEWQEENLKHGILSQEGMEVFSRILMNPLPQMLVSTYDFQLRLKQNNTFSPLNSRELIAKTHHSRTIRKTYVAPRNSLEKTVADIWQDFIGINPIGIYDNFFDLGGDSLIAVQLIAKLREIVKRELSPHSLLNAPTIAKLAELIEHLKITSSTHSNQPLIEEMQQLIPISSGTKTPLFLAPPVGGTVYFYRELTQYLPLDQPVYGLQAQGLDGKKKPLATIEEMATQYIQLLQTIQPVGPYFLGGASFGGTVAFEMAQQLNAQNQKVALIAMIDTPSPGKMPVTFQNDVDILVYLLNIGDDFAISSDELQQLNYDEQLKYFLSHGKMAHKLLPEITLNQLRYFLNLFKFNLQAMLNYQPQIYAGKIIFFRANERDDINPQNPELGWFDLATEGVKVYGVPGNHITMNYSPHVEIIAKQLKTYLP